MRYLNSFDSFNEGFWSDRRKRRNANKALAKAESQLNDQLKHLIGKKYGFQYKTYVWTSKSSNYQEIDHDQLTLNGVEIEPVYNLNSSLPTGAFFYLIFTDKHNDEISVYFPEDAITHNELDLEYSKPWEETKKALRGDARGEAYDYEPDKIDYDDPSRYPNRSGHFSYVPSEYKTIEMLSELKDILKKINEQVRDQSK